ncbi:hypothetical protein KP509_16G006100 [Ceratopteris richardii]|uniref:HhH-GPD domain-containing protein n=1 Tax=Ceratopteris richardii TaxID=49495 RepID=A0A8T2SZZ4_CERRI|nr:hypothetical protein KP509_16G006100 [Ceratopteris richardii]
MVETEHVNMMNYYTPYHEGSGNACSVQNHMDYWKYKGLERTECAFEEQQQMALCPKGKRSLLDRPPYWHESPFFQPHTELPLRDEDSSPRYAEYFLDHKPPIIACYSRKKKKIIKSKEILSSEQCTSSFTFPQVALGGSVVQSPKRIERKKRPMTLLSADADDRGEYKAGHMILRKTASRIKRSARDRRLRNSALSKAKVFNHAALTSKTRRCLHVKASKQSECHLKEQIDDRVHEYVQRNAYKSRHNPDPECKRSRPVRRMALRAQTNISYMLKSETNEHCIKPGAKPKRKKHRPKVQKEFFSPIPKTTPCNARENSISKVYFHLTRAKKTQKKSGRKKHLKTSPSKNRKRTQSQVGDLLGTGAFCVVNGCPEILNIIPANDLPGIKRIKDTLLLCLHGHPKSPISSVAEPSSASNEISQKISGKCRELALASNQELPASVRSNTQIVLYDQRRDTVLFKVPKKFKLVQPKVPISDENERIWPLLALGGIPADYEDQQYWEKERILMKERVTDFIWRMQEVQGDRRFSPWKGSVLDSVVGAFLTQNVQDHLSSSAFMCIASRFPAKHRNHENEATMGCPSQRESDSRTDFLIEKEIDFTVDYSGKTVKKQSRFHSITTPPKWSKKRNLSHISGIERARIEENLNGWKKNCSHDWESIRKKIMSNPSKDDMTLHENAVDWEAVRHCDVGDLAMAIKERGMHHVLSGRIKAFLKALEEEHGSIDLEWLRELSPENARAYLMSIHGLNVKSTECIRLLTLHHVAFPVDVHVGRICVRLGWVPIEPLPDQMQLHLLELYPLQETVQKYLWPRLCTLDQKTLYEFHYQLITFGKPSAFRAQALKSTQSSLS